MSLRRCLRCGASKRSKKQRVECSCGFYLAPISAKMLPVAKLLYELGFQISKAEEEISVIIDSGTIDAAMVHIVFARKYDEIIFEDMPAGYQYHCQMNGNGVQYCWIMNTENYYAALGGETAKEAVKRVIKELYDWAVELESSGMAIFYILAGML